MTQSGARIIFWDEIDPKCPSPVTRLGYRESCRSGKGGPGKRQPELAGKHSSRPRG